jgi:hypothetical protein
LQEFHQIASWVNLGIFKFYKNIIYKRLTNKTFYLKFPTNRDVSFEWGLKLSITKEHADTINSTKFAAQES